MKLEPHHLLNRVGLRIQERAEFWDGRQGNGLVARVLREIARDIFDVAKEVEERNKADK